MRDKCPAGQPPIKCQDLPSNPSHFRSKPAGFGYRKKWPAEEGIRTLEDWGSLNWSSANRHTWLGYLGIGNYLFLEFHDSFRLGCLTVFSRQSATRVRRIPSNAVFPYILRSQVSETIGFRSLRTVVRMEKILPFQRPYDDGKRTEDLGCRQYFRPPSSRVYILTQPKPQP